jgi:hypothetical protein
VFGRWAHCNVGSRMKALIGVSAALIAALHLPSAALERAGPDELTRSSPTGVRVTQAASLDLPATRVSGVSGTPIALSLKTPASGVRFIKISDFPEQLQLSRGFRLRGSWITAVADLENLELITPPGLAQTIKLDVLYFRNNQTPAVAQHVVTVELGPADPAARNVPQQAGRTAPVASPGQAPAAKSQAPAPTMTLSAGQETESLERGAILMRNGDIAAARLLYEDLAVNGSAKGARALAETYDPVYLKGVFIAGLRPNPEKAKIWYGRAAELGDSVSITRLGALDRR